MIRRRHRGFTLVELLVVITIIGMLMALLFPAISGVMGNALRTQCLSNLGNIGTACNSYATAKGYFPPEVQNPYKAQPATMFVLWPALILNEMNRVDLGRGLDDPTNNGGFAVYMEAYVCPANPPPDTNAAYLAYAANAGVQNSGGTATSPPDNKANGVFMPYLAGKKFDKVSMDSITDGTNYTLLVMETGINNMTWIAPTGSYKEGLGSPSAIWTFNANTPTSTTLKPVNDKDTSNKFLGQIASKHPGGAQVAMANGNARFLSDNVEPAVLELMFSSNGFAVMSPGSTTPVNQNKLRKLTDADLNK